MKNKLINLSSNLKLIKKTEQKEIDNIINSIKEIIKYSTDNKILIIYLKSEFWLVLLKQYNNPDIENINSCHRLRDLYKEYNNLIDTLYKDTTDEKEKNIKKDLNKYYWRDDFIFILNNNIKKLLKTNDKKFKEQEKLCIIEKYNPYYNTKDKADIERYKNNRETAIFNNIYFNNPSKAFKETFHNLNF